MIRFLLTPLFLALIAASAGYGGFLFLEANAREAIIGGLVLFAVLMVIANHFMLHLTIGRIKRRLAGFSGFEEDMIARMARLENNQANAGDMERLQKRLTRTEMRLESLEHSRPGAAKASGPLTAESESAFSGGKIVALDTGIKRAGGDGAAGAAPIPPGEIEKLLAGGRLSIRLQPIVELPRQTPVAVEVFGYLDGAKGMVAAAAALETAKRPIKAAYERQLIEEVARLIRYMESEEHILPAFCLVSSAVIQNKQEWERILQFLKSDPKLAGNLIPQISSADFAELETSARERFFMTREYGARPCLRGVGTAEDILALIDVGEFDYLKVAAETLFRYGAAQGERVVDTLLARLDPARVTLVAEALEKPHQVADLIDLDITMAVGEVISPQRRVRLYEGTGAPARRNIEG